LSVTEERDSDWGFHHCFGERLPLFHDDEAGQSFGMVLERVGQLVHDRGPLQRRYRGPRRERSVRRRHRIVEHRLVSSGCGRKHLACRRIDHLDLATGSNFLAVDNHWIR
jgi:hypothetical protein